MNQTGTISLFPLKLDRLSTSGQKRTKLTEESRGTLIVQDYHQVRPAPSLEGTFQAPWETDLLALYHSRSVLEVSFYVFAERLDEDPHCR